MGIAYKEYDESEVRIVQKSPTIFEVQVFNDHYYNLFMGGQHRWTRWDLEEEFKTLKEAKDFKKRILAKQSKGNIVG